ncbi:MAG: glycerol-3-phosphate 1-O-acyltransferase PlsY [Chloroflexaceae bacterium]|nr:glycerol-3-phosphate 1-O-acyltransferase PlsY [Chloroflexaceae bacterium]
MIQKVLGLMVAAYLVGSIPFSYLVARARGVDLRTVGSGNIGAANVYRACGRNAFLVAVVLDMLKGIVPTALARHTLKLPPIAVSLIGGSAMIGHTYSIFMNFRGGKAVATGGGALLMLSPLAMISGVGAWVVGFMITRISAVGSLAAAAVAAVISIAQMAQGRLERVYGIFGCIACGVVVFLHRANIRRMLEGTENRFQQL